MVDRHVGGDHHRVGGDHVLAGLHHRRYAAFDVVGMGAGENAPALVHDRLRDPGEVLQGVELRDVRKTQAGSGVERRERPPFDDLHRPQPGAPRGIELALEGLAAVGGGAGPVGGEGGVVAVEALLVAVAPLQDGDSITRWQRSS